MRFYRDSQLGFQFWLYHLPAMGFWAIYVVSPPPHLSFLICRMGIINSTHFRADFIFSYNLFCCLFLFIIMNPVDTGRAFISGCILSGRLRGGKDWPGIPWLGSRRPQPEPQST